MIRLSYMRERETKKMEERGMNIMGEKNNIEILK